MRNDTSTMTPAELFFGMGEIAKQMPIANRAFQDARNALKKAQTELAEIVRPEKMEVAVDRWLQAETKAVDDCQAVLEDLQTRYNELGRAVDQKRMEIDLEKIKRGIT